ncbi:MAG: 16S rRNA (guanine(966)-N(2))-methyltransferase RsmD [Gammaproteobacteria bacterium]|nr:16S rRNA (guanine(966)-N(2))-methyltransferase RsmD [Gammaproteobacteria bacterium]
MTRNSLRIIGGEWRGRRLPLAPVRGLRPTPDRVRETLFNWLLPWIADRSCLDLFAGSGALGFEALSRGATKVLMVEQSREAVAMLERNRSELAAENLTISRCDAVAFLRQTNEKFDLVFLDPPFMQGYVQRCCKFLQDKRMLEPGALLYLEAERSLDPLPIPHEWRLARSQTAGNVGYHLVEVV